MLKGEVLMFCLPVLPLRPWWNYHVVKFVFSLVLPFLHFSILVLCLLLCVVCIHMCFHMWLSVLLSFPVPKMVPLPVLRLPSQSRVLMLSGFFLHCQNRTPIHFPSIPFHSILFRVLVATEINHNRLLNSCLPH